MTDIFDKLKAQLAKSGALTDDELGDKSLTNNQQIWLSAERYGKQRNTQGKITLELYLDANKKLDNLPEGSPEYVAALNLVEQYESQA